MGFINSDFAKDLLTKVDIVDIISDYTDIKKKGAHFFGLSPFSEEKSASFCVNQRTQRFNCYSSGKAGNVVSFLMEKKLMSYPEAIESIAQKYGIPVQYENSEWAEKHKVIEAKKEAMRPLLLVAKERYQKALVDLPKEHAAKLEIERRGYNNDVIIDWQLGFAPGQQFIYNDAAQKSQLKAAEELGLVNIEKQCDKLWNRVLYPIHDIKGMLVGFAGRDISGKEKAAKWVNPSESSMYHKEETWYGLDRALQAIIDTGEVWIVEGYNDVIAWHTNGMENTIAPCGTAITEKQIKIIKKYTKRINFCFDDDKAGAQSMRKYIPIFLQDGFRVEVINLRGADPDDFVRNKSEEIKAENEFIKKANEFLLSKNDNPTIAEALEITEEEVVKLKALTKFQLGSYALAKVLEKETIKSDGFKILMDFQLKGTDLDKSTGAQRLCQIISKIEDDSMTEIYLAWLQKESKITRATLNKWVKGWIEKEALDDAKKLKKTQISDNTTFDNSFQYTIPDDVKTPFRDLKGDIYQYSMFIANQKIYMMAGSAQDGMYSFYPVTNFSIEIIQHMQDEKFPMKLLRIKNIHGMEKIFDVPSEQLNTPMGFDNAVTAHGNFLWTGGRNEFQKLRAYLFDKMGTGRKIDVLGWQSEGFWAWNNTVIVPGKESINLDENGIFEFEKISYYIPSANKIYSNNQFRYDAQKKFKVFESNVNFKNFVSKAIQVHREHAITAVLFSIASAFQDIITDELGNFPILFMQGPASTGKDQLAEICQSFFGGPQTAINLEGGVSTIKAQVREFAQFINSMSHLSEYKRGDYKLDGVLKGLWDRRGYKRGNIESHVGTESIPILSSVILTGNDYPDNEALITRLIWEEMTKNTFSDEEVKEFEELRDMTKNGISSFTNEILKHRKAFNDNFQKKYRMFKETFMARMPEAKSRMISNIAILGATYEIFKDILDFPFNFTQMETHFAHCTEKQINKLNSASIINKWWDCYLTSLRGHKDDRLQVMGDFKLNQKHLLFNFTNTYNKIQRQWWTQHHEAMPGKSTIIDLIKKDSSFIEYHTKGIYLNSGNGMSSTSAFEIDLEKINLTDEIMNAIQFQLAEDTIFAPKFAPPATPDVQIILKNENGDLFEYFEKE